MAWFSGEKYRILLLFAKLLRFSRFFGRKHRLFLSSEWVFRYILAGISTFVAHFQGSRLCLGNYARIPRKLLRNFLKIPFVSVSFPLAKRGVRKSENSVFHKEKIRFLARFSYAFLNVAYLFSSL